MEPVDLDVAVVCLPDCWIIRGNNRNIMTELDQALTDRFYEWRRAIARETWVGAGENSNLHMKALFYNLKYVNPILIVNQMKVWIR